MGRFPHLSSRHNRVLEDEAFREAAGDGGQFEVVAVAEDVVPGIGGVLLAIGYIIFGGGVHQVADALRKRNLGHQQRRPRRIVNLHMDMRCPAGIPPRKNAFVLHIPRRIRRLPAPQPVRILPIGRLHPRTPVLRIFALGIAMPNVHQYIGQRLAARRQILDR